MKINWDELTPEEILVKAKEAEAASLKLQTDVESLTSKRDELLTEVKKRKKGYRLLEDRGIDPRAEDFEDKFEALISLADKASRNPEKSEGTPPSTPGSQDVNAETKAAIERLENKIKELNTQYTNAQEVIKQKDEQEKELFMKNSVLDKLSEVTGISRKRAEHIYKLTKDKYRLAEDGKSVLGGDEYDPVSLDTVISNLRDSDEFGDYFPGSGNSGSGFQGSQGNPTTTNVANNPFAKGSTNATEAARIMGENPTKGKQMILQARAAGKLDPIMEKVYMGRI